MFWRVACPCLREMKRRRSRRSPCFQRQKVARGQPIYGIWERLATPNINACFYAKISRSRFFAWNLHSKAPKRAASARLVPGRSNPIAELSPPPRKLRNISLFRTCLPPLDAHIKSKHSSPPPLDTVFRPHHRCQHSRNTSQAPRRHLLTVVSGHKHRGAGRCRRGLRRGDACNPQGNCRLHASRAIGSIVSFSRVGLRARFVKIHSTQISVEDTPEQQHISNFPHGTRGRLEHQSG